MVASRRSVSASRTAARPRGPAIEAVALPVAVLVAVIVLVGMANRRYARCAACTGRHSP
jgi:hypothetical protein